MSTVDLTIPISEEAIRALHVGDTVHLSGVIVTGRDAAHKYMIENFIRADVVPESERALYEELRRLLDGSAIYHCGPVVRQLPPPVPPDNREGKGGHWEFVAAGPTTSIREEVYQPEVIAHFGLRGVIGKGGMGPGTLHACLEHGAAYFHAVGGAASLIADAVKEVVAVYKKDEFGVPEAFWVIRVEGFPVVVTMDSHGQSIHDEVEAASKAVLERLVATS
jgi:fumarate hydratase subunit beta